MPIVSLLFATSPTESISEKAIAAPAALTKAVSRAPSPTATSQPKNAAPQFVPPNSSR